jgi:preprotein translocase subunit Sss1
MTTLIAVLEFNDYATIAAIVVIFAGGVGYTRRSD